MGNEKGTRKEEAAKRGYLTQCGTCSGWYNHTTYRKNAYLGNRDRWDTSDFGIDCNCSCSMGPSPTMPDLTTLHDSGSTDFKSVWVRWMESQEHFLKSMYRDLSERCVALEKQVDALTAKPPPTGLPPTCKHAAWTAWERSGILLDQQVRSCVHCGFTNRVSIDK